MNCLSLRIVLLAFAWFTVTAPALGQVGDKVSWSGFWTMGAAGTDAEPTMAGLNRRASLFYDSLAGINGQVGLNDQWTATMQLLAKGEPNNFEPQLDWALASWQPTSNLTLRLGKQKVPAWMVSDHKDVGLLYPWIRPPIEVYSLNPISSFVGVGATLNWALGESTDLQAELIGGSARIELDEVELGGLLNLNIEDAMGANLTLSNGPASLRVTYLQAHLSGTFEMDIETPCSLVPGCTGPTDSTVRTHLTSPVTSDISTFTGLGLKWDDQKFLFMGEYAQQKNENSNLAEVNEAFYTTLGYKFEWKKRMLVHFTHAATVESEGTLATGLQHTDTLGLNTYLSDSLVAKLEWGIAEVTDRNGMFSVDPGRKVNVLGFALSAAF